MSKAKEVLTKMLDIISYETDIPAERIMSRCSATEIVDARWICVQLLKEMGYYPSRIAKLMDITPRYVQYILTDFNDRLIINRLMRTNYENIKNALRNANEQRD